MACPNCNNTGMLDEFPYGPCSCEAGAQYRVGDETGVRKALIEGGQVIERIRMEISKRFPDGSDSTQESIRRVGASGDRWWTDTALVALKQDTSEAQRLRVVLGRVLAALESVTCLAAEGPECYPLAGKKNIDLILDIGREAGRAYQEGVEILRGLGSRGVYYVVQGPPTLGWVVEDTIGGRVCTGGSEAEVVETAKRRIRDENIIFVRGH